MKVAAVIAALATVASAYYDNVTYVTETVTALTTYCPGPTKIVNNGKTITVTEVRRLSLARRAQQAGMLRREPRQDRTRRSPEYAVAWFTVACLRLACWLAGLPALSQHLRYHDANMAYRLRP